MCGVKSSTYFRNGKCEEGKDAVEPKVTLTSPHRHTEMQDTRLCVIMQNNVDVTVTRGDGGASLHSQT